MNTLVILSLVLTLLIIILAARSYKRLPNSQTDDDKVFWVRVAISTILLIATLYIIMFGNQDADTKKWAFSIVTLIAGYWLGKSPV